MVSRAGNNRIILATDGEFPVSDKALQLIDNNARQDIHLTVFTFGRNLLTSQNLQKLSQLGRSTYAHVTAEMADEQMIGEAKANIKKLAKSSVLTSTVPKPGIASQHAP